MVDVVVRSTLNLVCGPQEVRHGMGWVADDCNLIFYLDDGKIGGRYQIWVQDALKISVAMF